MRRRDALVLVAGRRAADLHLVAVLRERPGGEVQDGNEREAARPRRPWRAPDGVAAPADDHARAGAVRGLRRRVQPVRHDPVAGDARQPPGAGRAARVALRARAQRALAAPRPCARSMVRAVGDGRARPARPGLRRRRPGPVRSLRRHPGQAALRRQDAPLRLPSAPPGRALSGGALRARPARRPRRGPVAARGAVGAGHDRGRGAALAPARARRARRRPSRRPVSRAPLRGARRRPRAGAARAGRLARARLQRVHAGLPGPLPDGAPSRAPSPAGPPPTPGLRDWRRDMASEDVARFEAVAGDVLGELGY